METRIDVAKLQIIKLRDKIFSMVMLEPGGLVVDQQFISAESMFELEQGIRKTQADLRAQTATAPDRIDIAGFPASYGYRRLTASTVWSDASSFLAQLRLLILGKREQAELCISGYTDTPPAGAATGRGRLEVGISRTAEDAVADSGADEPDKSSLTNQREDVVSAVSNIRQVTQAEYDTAFASGTLDDGTMYVVVG